MDESDGLENRFGPAGIFSEYSHVLPGMQEEAALQFDEGMVKARIERETDSHKTAGSRSG